MQHGILSLWSSTPGVHRSTHLSVVVPYFLVPFALMTCESASLLIIMSLCALGPEGTAFGCICSVRFYSRKRNHKLVLLNPDFIFTGSANSVERGSTRDHNKTAFMRFFRKLYRERALTIKDIILTKPFDIGSVVTLLKLDVNDLRRSVRPLAIHEITSELVKSIFSK